MEDRIVILSFIHIHSFIHYQVPVMFQALFQGCTYSSEIDQIPALVRLMFLSYVLAPDYRRRGHSRSVRHEVLREGCMREIGPG